MLSLLKKNPEQSSSAHAKPWHPDFRNVAQLPDTKVVRTAFFVKAVAALAIAVMALLVGYQEYNLHDLGTQIAQLESQIASSKGPSQQAVALFGKFQAEEKKVQELEAFLKGNRVVLSQFLYKLGKTIPAKVSIKSVDYSDSGVVLRGLVVGTADQATSMVSAYEKQLKADDLIGKLYDTISLANLVRDGEAGRMTFEISMRTSQQQKGAKK